MGHRLSVRLRESRASLTRARPNARAVIASRAVDFTPSERVTELLERVNAFLDEHYYPRERELNEALDEEVRVGSDKAYPDELVKLRDQAKSEGLWNLFMPDEEVGVGLTNWE